MALQKYYEVFGTWTDALGRWGMFPELVKLIAEINIKYQQETVYPEKKKVFRVFKEVDFTTLKVVMLFQDPYHDGSATGIAVANDLTKKNKISPTLSILRNEWSYDQEISGERGFDGALTKKFDYTMKDWCNKGVLLLNCALTVKEKEAGSHLEMWREWTNQFLVSLTMEKQDLVFILLGKKAQAWKEQIINGHIIEAPHPAAETYAGGNAGFYGSRIFTKTNDMLRSLKLEPIEW